LRPASVYCPRKRTVAIESKVTGSYRLPHGAQYHGCMSLKPGQEVRVRSLPSSIDGKITKILPEPDGNDSVVIQISIRRRASDLELIPTPPTAEEVSATEARRAAAFKAWEANPSDPNRIEVLRATLRELGWLKDLPS